MDILTKRPSWMDEETYKTILKKQKEYEKSRLKFGIQVWCSKPSRDPNFREVRDHPLGTYVKPKKKPLVLLSDAKIVPNIPQADSVEEPKEPTITVEKAPVVRVPEPLFKVFKEPFSTKSNIPIVKKKATKTTSKKTKKISNEK
mgnify:CR=1 FL=1